jgi:hypothetical protein
VTWDERWLYWTIWAKLDSRFVTVPVHAIFVSMAAFSPNMVYRIWCKNDVSAVELSLPGMGRCGTQTHDLVIALHAAGTVFFWLAFSFVFHNLCIVRRSRVSFLRAAARTVGVKETQLQKCSARDEIIDLIVARCETDWPQTLDLLQKREREKRDLHHIHFMQTRFPVSGSICFR